MVAALRGGCQFSVSSGLRFELACDMLACCVQIGFALQLRGPRKTRCGYYSFAAIAALSLDLDGSRNPDLRVHHNCDLHNLYIIPAAIRLA
jgi:hypothetical protein